MLDLSVYKRRYYEVKLDENLTINIEPPKRKQLKKIFSLTKNFNNNEIGEEDIDNLYEAAEIAFCKNKENKVLNADDIEDYLDLAALVVFFDSYYSWVLENINQKN